MESITRCSRQRALSGEEPKTPFLNPIVSQSVSRSAALRVSRVRPCPPPWPDVWCQEELAEERQEEPGRQRQAEAGRPQRKEEGGASEQARKDGRQRGQRRCSTDGRTDRPRQFECCPVLSCPACCLCCGHQPSPARPGPAQDPSWGMQNVVAALMHLLACLCHPPLNVSSVS
jgi:hypothetical protein